MLAINMLNNRIIMKQHNGEIVTQHHDLFVLYLLRLYTIASIASQESNFESKINYLFPTL